MAVVDWWASQAPLYLADGYRLMSRSCRRRKVKVTLDHLLRHLVVIGSSGSGKTRLLTHILRQHLLANRSVTLIDPHGDLADQTVAFLAALALPGPINDEALAALGNKMVLLEPDLTYGAPSIHPLQPVDGQLAYLAIDGFLEIIRQLWGDNYGPRLEDLVRNCLTLITELGLTIYEVLPLLSDETFRTALVRQSHNPQIRLYFEGHLAGLRVSDQRAWFESSRNKFAGLLAHPLIWPLLAQQKSTIDFQDILNNGKWLVVNLSGAHYKESRRLLGGLLINLLHSAALAREQLPPRERLFHHLLIDELPEFWVPSLLRCITGARKLSLGIGGFFQHVNQPPFDENPAIMDTLLGSSHTRVMFSMARTDADRLTGDIFAPTGAQPKFQRHLLGIPVEQARFWSLSEEREHYAQQLMQQNQAEALISFKGRGEHEPYVCRIPHVPDIKPNSEKMAALREHCARLYCTPLTVIEAAVAERHQRILAAVAPPPRQQDNFFS